MKIAIEGCAHGELEKIYDTISFLEDRENVKIDLLICCGDFQSTRNIGDLRCMACPIKYQDICTFYKYYKGEKVAPILTIFIGGNHEASNYLQELSYGGWVAPNIFYLGYAGVVNFGGIRIGGISGIYKGHDFLRGHFEISPYNEDSKRSVYHIRNLEVFRLLQLSNSIDIFMSHDWPRGVYRYGDSKTLLKQKPFFREQIAENTLGSKPCEDIMLKLKPKYWFSAHLHCKFAALIPHRNEEDDEDDSKIEEYTKFLALDKCLPKRNFLQVVDIPHDENEKLELSYDLEWLTVLSLTNHLLSIKASYQYMPDKNTESSERSNFKPSESEKNEILMKFENNLKIPENFVPTAEAFNPECPPSQDVKMPFGQTNPQTELFCKKLNIDDPTNLVLMNSKTRDDSFNTSISNYEDEKTLNDTNDLYIDSPLKTYSPLNFIPASVERNSSQKLSMSSLNLPAPKDVSVDDIDERLCESIADSKEKSITEIEKDISNTESTESELQISSTPAKKFKRRNADIYTCTDDG